MSDAHTADDLTHEAFYLVLRALRSGHGPRYSFARYLQATVRRLAYRYVAGWRRTIIAGDTEEWERYLLPMPSPAPQNDLVAAAWATLPPRWRRILWLIEVERYTPAELAAQMSMTPSAVSSLAVRARRGLHAAYLAMQRTDLRLAPA
ncbi:RNA polymerase sigma factor, partial [Phytoactinopolyspora endophytica]|uniref:RNA polymerase sigma factor n=1 Tax=Phytoactinopolyspora endophytica TaxID=1642495 RepID=UPI001F10D905